ncbi:glycosyltransferase [Vampirovibrio sp.]|uniref:glycosyltransferase n=1 Tax=Vampirovibrio sp. TaxID=2717857 RepID=UPI003593E282
MQVSDFNIQRDSQYYKVLGRDNRRQQARRFAHRLGCWYEALWVAPRLTSLASQDGGRPPRLSTCIMTMNSAERIRPLLQYIRRFSDEIVVGVDSKTTDNTLEACQGLADELFVIPSDALTCNAGLEALVARCHGDWILRLDDDEFPEPRFEKMIGGLMRQRHYTHYKIPRLHLCQVEPEPLRWIDDGYLYPDYQMRLFRNDPSLLKFPGAVGHLGIECQGPKGRLNTVNLVHLNLAINPRFKREAKLSTYIERLNGGWVHPVNEHALLFEDFNYRIKPYHHPDADFRALLKETTLHQRQIYEQAHSGLAFSPH